MAGPKKPKGRDYPLSMTPEPVNGLTLSRANALERRTPEKIISDASNVYDKEITALRRVSKPIIKNGVIQADNSDKQEAAYPRLDAAYKSAKSKDPKAIAKGLEKNLKAEYKIPTKKKR